MNKTKHVLFFLLLSFGLNSQNRVMKNYNTKTGIPSNEVYFLHQDKKGYIWACTDAGITKFNGSSFTVYNSTNGLPDNTVFEVKEDQLGRMWFRTFAGKLGYIMNDSIVTIQASDAVEKFIKEGIISSFAIDQFYNIIIGKRNTDTIAFLKIAPPYAKENVKRVWIDQKGQKGIKIVLVGKRDFVFSDTRGNAKEYNIDVYAENGNKEYSDTIQSNEKAMFTRVFRNNQHLFVIVNNNLKEINLDTKKAKDATFQTALVTAIRLDSNRIAIGERQKGITIVNNELQMFSNNNELKGYTFTHSITDYQGGQWYATLESGIFYAPFQFTNYYKLFTDETEQASRLFKLNDSSLIVGSNHGSLLLICKTKAGPVLSRLLYSDREGKLGKVSVVYALNPNKILASGSEGTIDLDLRNGKANRIWKFGKGNISCIKILEIGDELLGITISGWFTFTKGNYQSLKEFHPSNDRLTSMSYDKKQIYVGGLKGLYKLDLSKQIIDTAKILDTRIEDIQSNSNIYIATRNKGLIILRRESTDTLNERYGMISDICNAVLVNGDIIWVSTNKGISKIKCHSQKRYDIQNYPLNSFLDPSTIGNLLVLQNRLWFFSENKLFSFDVKTQKCESRVYINSILVNDKRMAIQKAMILKPEETNILIKYEALFYNTNGLIRYRYKINEGETNWTYTKEEQINFVNLAPGNYQFCLEAQNVNGDWIKADQIIHFKIPKPYWQTIWFIVVLSVCISLVIGLILTIWYKNVLRKEKESNDLKLLMNDLETKAVKAQMNPHFIFNSLNTIQHFILSKDTDNAYKYLSKFAKLVRMLLESNTSNSMLLREEIEILKRYIEIEALRFQQVFSFDFEIDPKLNVDSTAIPHMLIQPFIENAIWHGLLNKEGEKILQIRLKDVNENYLICEVEDNGVGRSEHKEPQNANDKKKSLAIVFIKERLDLLSKKTGIKLEIEVIDKVNDQSERQGTLVRIMIPKL